MSRTIPLRMRPRTRPVRRRSHWITVRISVEMRLLINKGLGTGNKVIVFLFVALVGRMFLVMLLVFFLVDLFLAIPIVAVMMAGAVMMRFVYKYWREDLNRRRLWIIVDNNWAFALLWWFGLMVFLATLFVVSCHNDNHLLLVRLAGVFTSEPLLVEELSGFHFIVVAPRHLFIWIAGPSLNTKHRQGDG